MLPHSCKTRPARPARTRRILALVLLCLCLAGQLSGFAHLVTVQHAVCPEHGEVVHGPPGGSEVALAPALALGGQLPALSPSSAPAAGHEHDHCLLLSQRRGQAVPEPAPRPVRNAAQPARQVPGREVACCARSIALLRLAPKNSPPV
jgi:hypothetical protein